MSRLEVLKTYKIYVGGKFPRTESGRYYSPKNNKGKALANVCLCSRKDFREAVVAARNAFGVWSGKSAFNRSQILYRIAEMLESRSAQFVEELIKQGATANEAKQEVAASIDLLVYYSGWCDKYHQVIGTVNPVNSSHFNFSTPEPMGVVGVFAEEKYALFGLISIVAPIIAGGNTAVVLASESKPLSSISFAEVIHSSDVPNGVINILTGKRSELLEHFASHMDVNAIAYLGNNKEELKTIQQLAALNVKRVFDYSFDLKSKSATSLYTLTDFQEIKTTWHPIENIGGANSTY